MHVGQINEWSKSIERSELRLRRTQIAPHAIAASAAIADWHPQPRTGYGEMMIRHRRLHHLVHRRQIVRWLRIRSRARIALGQIVRTGHQHDVFSGQIVGFELFVGKRPILTYAVLRFEPEVVRPEAWRLTPPAIGAATKTEGEIPRLLAALSDV